MSRKLSIEGRLHEQAVRFVSVELHPTPLAFLGCRTTISRPWMNDDIDIYSRLMRLVLFLYNLHYSSVSNKLVQETDIPKIFLQMRNEPFELCSEMSS